MQSAYQCLTQDKINIVLTLQESMEQDKAGALEYCVFLQPSYKIKHKIKYKIFMKGRCQ